MKEKITFTELVSKIALETGTSKRLVRDLLSETVRLTREGLGRDKYVNLLGIGRFRLKFHKAKTGRNPQTGGTMEIPPHSSVHFKAEAGLRDYINRKYSHLQHEVLKDETEKVKDISEDPSIQQELKPTQTVSVPTTSVEKTKKKPTLKWLWLLIPVFLIVILIIIFRPFQETSETDAETLVDTEEVDKMIPALPEKTEQPEEKPVIEDVGPAIPGGQHMIEPGDKLWSISKDFYGRTSLWPNIYRANINNIINPDVLITGQQIQIPPLQGKPGNLTDKDVEDIAEGFIEVYLIYKQYDKEDALNYLWIVKKMDLNKVIDKYRERIINRDLELVSKIEGDPELIY